MDSHVYLSGVWGGATGPLVAFKSKEMRTEGVKPKQAKETSAPHFFGSGSYKQVLRVS